MGNAQVSPPLNAIMRPGSGVCTTCQKVYFIFYSEPYYANPTWTVTGTCSECLNKENKEKEKIAHCPRYNAKSKCGGNGPIGELGVPLRKSNFSIQWGLAGLIGLCALVKWKT